MQGRPVSFFYEEYSLGEHGLPGRAVCARGARGRKPGHLVECSGCDLVMVWLVISRRDWRAGAVVASLAAGWLPWFWYADHDDRTMFSFYAVSYLPFLIMASLVPRVRARAHQDSSTDARTVGATRSARTCFWRRWRRRRAATLVGAERFPYARLAGTVSSAPVVDLTPPVRPSSTAAST